MSKWFPPVLAIAGAISLAVPAAKADTLVFSDDFQTTLNDGNWSLIGSARLVQDPLNPSGLAMTFDTPIGGGDLWSNSISGPGGTYTAGFYFLANCANEYECGAFFGGSGTSDEWIASDQPYNDYVFADTNVWTWVTFQFTAGTNFQIKMEDYSGSPGSGPDAVFFKDLQVASGNDPLAAPGLTATPEPGSLALLGTGLTSVAMLRRRFLRS